MLRQRVRKPLAVMALVVALVLTSRLLFEAVFYPWARSFGLWPVLVGTWHGEMHGPAGTTPVFVELRSRYMGSSSVRHLQPIGGRLRWCHAPAAIRDYTLRGDVGDWRGTRFEVAVDATEGQAPGEAPDEITAEWRGDTIEATGTLWRRGGHTASAEATRGSAYSAEVPQVRYVLRRGAESEFVAVCSGAG